MSGENDKSKSLEKFYAQMQESARLLREQLAPAIKTQELLAEKMRPFIEAQNVLQKSLEPFIESHRCTLESLNGYILSNDLTSRLSEISKPVIEFQNRIQHLISPAFENMQKSLRELPERTRTALITLGNHGWFLDLEMPLPGLWEIQKAMNEGNVDEIEKELVEYFTERLDDIEKSITSKYPHRSNIISSAFRAHSRGEYELSIPVFLSQTDGICHEVIEQHFFLKKNKKPKTAIYVEKIATDTYRAALLEPLAQTLPIGASQNEREKDFSELNRHMVLHGESLDYGTEKNSLKAISLLNYVCHVLKIDEDES